MHGYPKTKQSILPFLASKGVFVSLNYRWLAVAMSSVLMFALPIVQASTATFKGDALCVSQQNLLTNNAPAQVIVTHCNQGEQVVLLALNPELQKFYSQAKLEIDKVAESLGLKKEINLIRELTQLRAVTQASDYQGITAPWIVEHTLTSAQTAQIRLKTDLSNVKEVATQLFDTSHLTSARKLIVNEKGKQVQRPLTAEELTVLKAIYAQDHKNALKVLKQIKKYSTQKLPTKENPNPKPAPYSADALKNFVTLFNYSLDNPLTGTVKHEIARRNLNNSLAIAQYISVNSDVFNKNEKYYSNAFFTKFMTNLTEYLMTTTKNKEGNVALKVEIGFKEESYKYSFPTQSWINELPIQSPNLNNALELSLSYLRKYDSFGKLMHLTYENIFADRELAGKEEELAGKEEELAGNKFISGLLKKANSDFKNGKYKSAKDLYSQIINSNVKVSPSVAKNIDFIKKNLEDYNKRPLQDN